MIQQNRYWLWALDPLHIGSGRQQISRIDLPCVREQGTGLPIIPGTSLSGVCRAYAALEHGKSGNPLGCAGIGCAGKGGDDGESHCGKCAVCFAFGFSKGKQKKSRQGLVQISTAQIIYFPVATLLGPVWITCPMQLALAGLDKDSLSTIHASVAAKQRNYWWIAGPNHGNPLCFGWLALPCGGTLNPSTWLFTRVEKPGEDSQRGNGQSHVAEADCAFLDRAIRRVLVSDELFVRLVNDNMEVRTLVSIDPNTGAAKDSALFTYEAVPRGTLFSFDVVFTSPELFGLDPTLAIRDAVHHGFMLMQYLGLGGMNTRGLGRAEIPGTSAAEAPNQQRSIEQTEVL
jgi:CRISPR-associated protein Cmr4